jgi:hypothetical protein
MSSILYNSRTNTVLLRGLHGILSPLLRHAACGQSTSERAEKGSALCHRRLLWHHHRIEFSTRLDLDSLIFGNNFKSAQTLTILSIHIMAMQ